VRAAITAFTLAVAASRTACFLQRRCHALLPLSLLPLQPSIRAVPMHGRNVKGITPDRDGLRRQEKRGKPFYRVSSILMDRAFQYVHAAGGLPCVMAGAPLQSAHQC
jgi:hypothetical protein